MRELIAGAATGEVLVGADDSYSRVRVALWLDVAEPQYVGVVRVGGFTPIATCQASRRDQSRTKATIVKPTKTTASSSPR
jgi:hypothetical protein